MLCVMHVGQRNSDQKREDGVTYLQYYMESQFCNYQPHYTVSYPTTQCLIFIITARNLTHHHRQDLNTLKLNSVA
jgi:hypothetical protein